MEFLKEEVENYAASHTTKEPELLEDINRDTYANVLMPRMLSGHFQGRILATFSHMISPDYILEIGTYTGYSALCMAEGLKTGGKLITIDINEELEEKARNNFSRSPFNQSIDFRIGNALTLVPDLQIKFDLIFIDADKENYLNYYEMVLPELRKGGYIIADNVLWSGKVLDKNQKKIDKDTSALIEFNDFTHNDDRVENVLLPIRDGLMILRKL